MLLATEKHTQHHQQIKGRASTSSVALDKTKQYMHLATLPTSIRFIGVEPRGTWPLTKVTTRRIQCAWPHVTSGASKQASKQACKQPKSGKCLQISAYPMEICHKTKRLETNILEICSSCFGLYGSQI